MKNPTISALRVIIKIISILSLAGLIFLFVMEKMTLSVLILSAFGIVVSVLIFSLALLIAEALLSMAKSQASIAESQKVIAVQLAKQAKQNF